MLVSALLTCKDHNKEYNRLPNFKGILEVKHHIPGRIRMSCPTLKNNKDKSIDLVNVCDKIPGIISIRINENLGTILIEYDTDVLQPLLIIGIILILLVVLLGAIVGTSIATKNRKNKINKNKSKWKTEAVISPEKGSLQPAGYITINWKSADKMGRVHKYQIYVDDKKQGEVSGNKTTFEYYTTKVSIHKVYIKAILDHGNEVNSDVFGFYVNKKGFCMNKDMAEHVNADHWNVSW